MDSQKIASFSFILQPQTLRKIMALTIWVSSAAFSPPCGQSQVDLPIFSLHTSSPFSPKIGLYYTVDRRSVVAYTRLRYTNDVNIGNTLGSFRPGVRGGDGGGTIKCISI